MSNTKKFRVTAEVTISMSTLVDAKNATAAKEKAMERGMMSLCHHCASGEDTREWVTSGELDGEPMVIRAEVES